jgi:hypothetical protein
MIRFMCPHCHQVLTVPPESGGSAVSCPACHSAMRVPVVPAPRPVAVPVTATAPPPIPMVTPVLQPSVPDVPEEVIPVVRPYRGRRDGDESRRPVPEVFPALEQLPLEPLPQDCPAEANVLGKPLATLRGKPINAVARALVFLVGIVFLLVGVGLGLLLLLTFVQVVQNQTRVEFREVRPYLFLTIVGIFGGVGMVAFGARALSRRRRKRLWLCQGGVVLRCDGVTHWYGWGGFPAFWCRVTGPGQGRRQRVIQSYYFEIQDPNGLRQRFDSSDYGLEAKAVGDHIQSESKAALFAVYSRRLEAGNPVEFYPFLLSSQGLEHRAVLIPWGDLAGMEVDAGVVLFITRDRVVWAQEALGQVAHAQLFLSLAGHLLEKNDRRRRG